MISERDCIDVIRDCNLSVSIFTNDVDLVATVVCEKEIFKKEYSYDSLIDSPAWGRGQQLLDTVVFDALRYFVGKGVKL